MNSRTLKELKIDKSFVMSPDKFLKFYGGTLVIDKNFKRLSLGELQYMLGKGIKRASKKLINIENILKGEIILVGRPNDFCAYHRPIGKNPDLIKPKCESKERCVDEEISFIRLFELYDSSSNIDQKQECMMRIFNLSYEDNEYEQLPTREKLPKTKTHSYKRSRHQRDIFIDKRR